MNKLLLLQWIFHTVPSVCVTHDIRLPPYIIQQPEDVTFRSGGSFDLKCTARGVPDVEFEWLQNKQILELSNPNVRVIGGLKDGSIRIKAAGKSNEGFYQCIAWNQWGQAISQVAKATHAYLKMDGDTAVRNYTASIGEYLKVVCETNGTFPEPSVEWAVASDVVATTAEPLLVSDRVQIDLEGNLHFMNIQKTDERIGYIYKCIMKNSHLDLIYGKSYSQVTVLSEIYQRNITNKPRLVFPNEGNDTHVAILGQDLVLQCLFSALPTPNVTWTKRNGQLPPYRHKITSSGTKLTITNVTWEDEASYECMGSNNVDSTNHVINVSVQAVPTFKRDLSTRKTIKPVNLNVTEGDSANFSCAVDAKPTATIHWSVNGEQINDTVLCPHCKITENGTRLTVDNTCKVCGGDITHLMVVQCNASNQYGYAFSQGYLNVLERTKLTIEPKDVKLKDQGIVVFECNATSDPSTQLTYRWYHNNIEIDAGRAQYGLEGPNLVANMNISDLEAIDKRSGNYTCQVTNGYSTSSATASLQYIRFVTVITPPKSGFVHSWMLVVLIVPAALLPLLCYAYRRHKGRKYSVEKEDITSGNDPLKELEDNYIQPFVRLDTESPKDGNLSLKQYDEDSVFEFEDLDAETFHEDGSFIGLYTGKTTPQTD